MAISRSQIKKQLLELGGRIGLQEGGGIEQRLEQLGGDVTSAERMLQGINQRLKTAESSLGSGGGMQSPFTDQGSIVPQGGGILGLGNIDNQGISAEMIAEAKAEQLGRPPNDPYARTLLSGLSQDGQRFDSAQSAFDALAEQTRKIREFHRGRDMVGTELFQGAEGFKNFTNMFNQINDPNYVAPSPQLLSAQGSLGIPAAGYADGGIANRQKYGLGSFVKKITRKVTKPVTKVAQKIVPKEIAGIMRVAAPFLPPGYREAAYLLGTAKQTGRISPVDLALALAPSANQYFAKDKTMPFFERQGFLAEQFPKTNEFLFGAEGFTDTPVNRLGMVETASKPATTGILGTGGKMFQFGKGAGPAAFRDQTKLGSFLLEGDPGKFSMSKLAGLGIGALSLIQNAKTPEEAGTALAEATGNSDDYERGKELFAKLPQGIFDIPEQFRLQSKDGGLMRENYALGTMPTAQESGLGGLPIEADMRYTGGFMPYGAKEKADDVPARLSKNEFVFTADAVRAAGGGSVNEGAKKMYQAMKQLEAKPEAKGMMA